ncbi:MAG: hypothetical protein P1V20_01655 [Verrucomicrobiales bacterium]|nr:hypothetical protein [Verrucomicrobiales bacterium]
MKKEDFNELAAEERDWIDAWIDETIEPEEFDLLQDRMMASPALRRIVRRYQGINHALQSIHIEADSATGPWLVKEEEAPDSTWKEKIVAFPVFIPMAAVAALAFFFGLGLMYVTRSVDPGNQATTGGEKPSASGFAVIERIFDPVWEAASVSRQEGDLLGAENFVLQSGTAEIQFFSGATMTVEGPAEIEVKSAWEAVCREGLVRMQVPPAARGFKLQAPSAEIVDLGTEFGLEVRAGVENVEVFDGEILLHRDGQEAKSMKKGASLALSPEGTDGKVNFPNDERFEERSIDQRKIDFDSWKTHRDSLAKDQRLIAYYTFDRNGSGSRIPNLAMPRKPDTDGTFILAEPVAGRWPGLKGALEFRRPGSRMRMNLPGEFSAFSFVCWVRVDSLDRQYNALFMGDGYENGEPHWQIREDGKMMLSVMIDDSRPNPEWPKSGDRFHRVYFSPPIWDLSNSGEWMHLASVFDPVGKAVSHYVNGEQVSSQEIEPLYQVTEFRIGNAEVGNWGLPFRSDPNFAIRNLNGRMDEIAIFDAALSEAEIADLYEKSRSARR